MGKIYLILKIACNFALVEEWQQNSLLTKRYFYIRKTIKHLEI